jgi:hypothetical protein
VPRDADEEEDDDGTAGEEELSMTESLLLREG